MSAAVVTAADLRPIDLFDDIDDDALDEWAAAAGVLDVEPGQLLVDAGETAPGLLLILEGIVQVLLMEEDRGELVGRNQAPTWMGAIGVLTEGPMGVRMQAETACRIGLIQPNDFRRLLFATPAVHRRVMRQFAPVMSRVTAVEQNRERLASLGTMAAGLAHELNNPAAAARRAASQMIEALDTVNDSYGRFVEARIGYAHAVELMALHEEAVEARASRTTFAALDAADAEDELLDCLEQMGVPEPWTLTEPLAGACLGSDWLKRVKAAAGDTTPGVLRWIAATLTAHELAEELRESTERMSGLVGAVKAYAYMDRGELVEVDLHEGLETTIVVLGHKLKKTAIEVVRDYDRELPKLTVRGSELNQVWTNLLDNAIDALGDSGTITITSRLDDACVEVDISDDGPGIAADDLDRVFDSFFTTKDVGRGTGLGLATALRIVADRHDGTLTVDSEPGRTTFRVRLPLTQR
jgi:signal transduction histidine kinase